MAEWQGAAVVTRCAYILLSTNAAAYLNAVEAASLPYQE
jgi:hypothetical protein